MDKMRYFIFVALLSVIAVVEAILLRINYEPTYE